MKILFVDSCIRGEMSRTLQLCLTFIDALKKTHPGIETERINLEKEEFLPLKKMDLNQRDQLINSHKLLDPFFSHAHKFAQADYIIVGAPYWDLSFPAVLKTYIEHICVCGIAFRYEGTQCIGLCKAKKMIYISTVGGYLTGTHMGEQYMNGIAEMTGIRQFDTYCLEGLDIYGEDVEGKMKTAHSDMEDKARLWIL